MSTYGLLLLKDRRPLDLIAGYETQLSLMQNKLNELGIATPPLSSNLDEWIIYCSKLLVMADDRDYRSAKELGKDFEAEAK